MKKRSPLFVIFLALMAFMLFTGEACDDNNTSSAEDKQTKQTDKILSEINSELGLPNIKYFQQKRLMKKVYEMCDQEDLICYAYTQSEYSGKLVYLGKCMGFGVPFSAQYTNPEKVVYSGGHNESFGSLPQADPNGLYMPTSSSATWLLMIDPATGETHATYFESVINVSPFPLHKIAK